MVAYAPKEEDMQRLGWSLEKEDSLKFNEEQLDLLKKWNIDETNIKDELKKINGTVVMK